MVKVLVVGREPVGALMAGPAIRCWELANTLSGDFDVTLAVPPAPELPAIRFRLMAYQHGDRDSLGCLARQMDAIVISGYVLADFPELARTGRPLIVDVYDPFPIENLGLHRRLSIEERVAISESDFSVLCDLLKAGDFFLCGGEQQRRFWLGMLAACGRLNPLTYEEDPTFRSLIEVVPMGIPDEPPAASDLLRGFFPGIGPDDFLLVWPGGLWEWLDPLTAVEAIHLLADEAPDVKLLFPGVRHPNPDRIGPMETPDSVLARSRELGLLGTRVFCHDWTPYGERGRYLLDADAALSLHFDGVESDLAIRARLLDCVWAATPVIATRGDAIAEALAQRGLAKLVPPRDPLAVAEAILSWRSNRNGRTMLAEAFRELSAEYRWSRVSRPLAEFLRQPRRAADRCGDSMAGRGAGREEHTPEARYDGHTPSLQRSLSRETMPAPRGEEIALAEALARLRQRETDLAAARELLHRIEQGKLMRLMRSLQSSKRNPTR